MPAFTRNPWSVLCASMAIATAACDAPPDTIGPDSGEVVEVVEVVEEVPETAVQGTEPAPCDGRSERADIPLAYYTDGTSVKRTVTLRIVPRPLVDAGAYTFTVYKRPSSGGAPTKLGATLSLSDGNEHTLTVTPAIGELASIEVYGSDRFAVLVNVERPASGVASAPRLAGDYEIYSISQDPFGERETKDVIVTGINAELQSAAAASSQSTVFIKNTACVANRVKTTMYKDGGEVVTDERPVPANAMIALVFASKGTYHLEGERSLSVVHEQSLRETPSTANWQYYHVETAHSRSDVSARVWVPQVMVNNGGFMTDLLIHNPASYAVDAHLAFSKVTGAATCQPSNAVIPLGPRSTHRRAVTLASGCASWIGFATVRYAQPGQAPPTGDVRDQQGGLVVSVRQYASALGHLSSFAGEPDEGYGESYWMRTQQGWDGYGTSFMVVNPTSSAQSFWITPHTLPTCAKRIKVNGVWRDAGGTISVPASGGAFVEWPRSADHLAAGDPCKDATAFRNAWWQIIRGSTYGGLIVRATQFGPATLDLHSSPRPIDTPVGNGARGSLSACLYSRSMSVLGQFGHVGWGVGVGPASGGPGTWWAGSTENVDGYPSVARYGDNATWYRKLGQPDLRGYMASTTPSPPHRGGNYHEERCATLPRDLDRFKLGRALNFGRTDGYSILPSQNWTGATCLDHSYYTLLAAGVPEAELPSPTGAITSDPPVAAPDPQRYVCAGLSTPIWGPRFRLHEAAPLCLHQYWAEPYDTKGEHMGYDGSAGFIFQDISLPGGAYFNAYYTGPIASDDLYAAADDFEDARSFVHHSVGYPGVLFLNGGGGTAIVKVGSWSTALGATLQHRLDFNSPVLRVVLAVEATAQVKLSFPYGDWSVAPLKGDFVVDGTNSVVGRKGLVAITARVPEAAFETLDWTTTDPTPPLDATIGDYKFAFSVRYQDVPARQP